MASILKVDEMQGVTSAGDITITSEGGSATQSLQQGVLKMWANLQGDGTVAIRDSLNCASITDNGTGVYNRNFTNLMSSATYSIGAVAMGDVANLTTTSVSWSDQPSTSDYRTRTFTESGGSLTDKDAEQLYDMMAGDLA